MIAFGHAPVPDKGQALEERRAPASRTIGGEPTLDPATKRAVRAFVQSLDGKYSIIDALVFGNRARGTHREDSDADVAIILRGERGNRYKVSGEMAEIAFDVMMAADVLVHPFPLWEDELRRPELFSNPALLENLRRDGLRL